MTSRDNRNVSFIFQEKSLPRKGGGLACCSSNCTDAFPQSHRHRSVFRPRARLPLVTRAFQTPVPQDQDLIKLLYFSLFIQEILT